MSDKTYSADQVAKHVLKKYHDLAKGLFAEQLKCEAPKSEDSKESVFHEIKWCLQSIKDLKELSWTVESEAPNAKDIFEKVFEKEKDRLATLVRRHKALKKSEETEEEKEVLTKAEQVDEIWKAEKYVGGKEEDKAKKKDMDKCGDMKIMKADDSKLKAFIENKKAKKAGKMEKMLGMNQAPAQPQVPGLPGSQK